MLHRQGKNSRGQIGFYSLEDLVPQDHYLRAIDKYVDFDFIYDLVEPLYSETDGRPSLDPVVLIKLPLLQYLENIKSMRQTVEQVQVNTAYRWFLGLSLEDHVPHFSTFGKNYTRRFKGTDLFEQIFFGILTQAIEAGLVNSRTVFVDGTHIKAHANAHKYEKKDIQEEPLFYLEQLRAEIREDRVLHEKKALKSLEKEEIKTKKISRTDPESGWFHKGEHKEVFAYCAQVACDEHGWVLGFTTHAGNEHDSRTFKSIHDLLMCHYTMEMMVMDAGYKTPAIAHLLREEGITPILPYKRPMTKEGFLKKVEFVYDAEFDGYTCPNGQWMSYNTTNRRGYREYKSNPKHCIHCPLLSVCTQSKNHVKVITRHLWERDLEACEQLRRLGFTKAIYAKRKETIERLFGAAKEFHGLRYTQQKGREAMHAKLALTLACLNIKKFAKMMRIRDEEVFLFYLFFKSKPILFKIIRKPTEVSVGLSTV